jgi:fatty acid desaturase
MLAAYFALLWWTPLWLAFVPGVLLAHRIGILGHEYIHGIPLKKYRHCHAVVSVLDGAMMMFGVYELYRGMHLAHHRWLNGAGDPAAAHIHEQRAQTRPRLRHRLGALLGSGEVAKHLRLLGQGLRGRHPYARAGRIVLGMASSLAWIGLWIAIGHGDVAWKSAVIVIATAAGPSSLRAAIEHYAPASDPGFANEYEVVIPLLNLNKHLHHHLEPRLPWYLLEFKTPRPLAARHYFTHWYHVHVTRDFELMKPHQSRSPGRRQEKNLATPSRPSPSGSSPQR